MVCLAGSEVLAALPAIIQAAKAAGMESWRFHTPRKALGRMVRRFGFEGSGTSVQSEVMSSSSKSNKTTKNFTTNVNASNESGAQIVNSAGAEITVTDFGAGDRAFTTVDDAVSAVSNSSKNALAATKELVSNQVESIKNLATTLAVGDIESSKFIAFAIIAAVVIALVAYFWLS